MGAIDVTAMEFAGQAAMFDVRVSLDTSDNWPFTTTQLPMGGYDEGRFCRA